ncbi:MAG: sugar transferase [Candidatus Promineifilaceae bacterium]
MSDVPGDLRRAFGLVIGSRRPALPSLGLRAAERRLLLLVMDVAFLSLALIIAIATRTDLLTGAIDVVYNAKWFVTLALLWAMVASVFDAYNLRRAAGGVESVWGAGTAAAVTGGLYLAIPWLTPPLLNRSLGFLFLLLAVISISAWRLLYARLFAHAIFQRRALVIGAGRSGRDLVLALQRPQAGGEADTPSASGQTIVGFVDDDPARSGERIEGLPVLGNSAGLMRLVQGHNVDEVILAISNRQAIRPELFEAILDCRENGVPVVSMAAAYERLTGRVPFEHLSQHIEVAAGEPDGAALRMYLAVKRLVDIGGALLSLVPLLLLATAVAAGNALSSPGPLYYRQQRVGRAGRPFWVIKFRSMLPEAEEGSGAVWASQRDPRVTRVGRWLRLAHLDELPQAVNVLRGEMSLVGPRPERPEFVARLSGTIPFYRARHAVRPGITGWAQIHQDYGDSEDLAREKLEYDLYYIRHAGPMLDSIILLRTVFKVLAFRGR